MIDLLRNSIYVTTVELRYPDTRFSRRSACHVNFSVYDFNVNKLRILRH